MRRFFLLLATTICGLAAVAPTAVGSLPTILTLSGSEAEFEISGSLASTEVARFNSTFATLKANSVSARFFGKNMSHDGSASLTFKEVTLGASSCQTEGSAGGEVSLPGIEWHVVGLSIFGFIFKEWLISNHKISCNNGLKFTVQGSVLTKVNTSGDVTTVETETQCESAGSRKAKWKSYDSDTGTGTAKLEANPGLGWEEVCLELKSPLVATSTEMQEDMNP